ncbi:MAG: K(+)-transporting ATPase subunit F [Actinomycetota bacterium]|nr:K(+)-transporting ATPase subunit F [Actinomycetota bacterium]
MTINDVVLLALSVAMMGYLGFALIRPEKL